MSKHFEHPAFPQPDNDDVSLWRYMNFDKFNWMLENGRLFIPTADRLGDTWEGKTPQGYVDWWEQQIQTAATDMQKATFAHNRDFLAKISQAFRPYFYVSCWHMNDHENYAMWNCYTSSKEAVAVRTTYRQLLNALPDYAYRGLVRYIDYAADRLPSMNLFEYITHKDKFFSYEQEVRAVFLPAPNDKETVSHFTKHTFELASSPGFRVFAPPIDLSKLINAIVLHPDSNDDFRRKIQDLCEKYSLPAPELSRKSQPNAT